MLYPLAQAADPTANAIMIAGIVLIAAVLLLNIRKRFKARDAADDDTPRDRLDRMDQVSRTRNDMRSMMVELEELTRRFGAQLDNKSRRLDRLLEEADERIAELRRLQGLPPRDPATHSERDGRESTGAMHGGDAPHAGDAPGDAFDSADAPGAGGDPTGGDPFAGRVYALADDGKDAHQIARELDEHVGKIELILALRQPT